MKQERYNEFTLLIEGTHKLIQKIKVDKAKEFGIKGVHVFWLCRLLAQPDGMTSAELAAQRMIDRSLVSREIDELLEKGYVQIDKKSLGKRRSYNSIITLTPEGEKIAKKISDIAIDIQSEANKGIREAELVAFYRTLSNIYNNLYDYTEQYEEAKKTE